MKNIIIHLFVLLFFSEAIAENPSDIRLSNLKTEYTKTPLGIDIEKPRFSWNMQSSKNGAYQKAYQIEVTNESGNKVWDSGRVNNYVSLNIRYEGTPLQPTTRYHWQLTVWDGNNKKLNAGSWFETGLMSTETSVWGHAKWIGGGKDDLVLYSHYLPVFGIGYCLQLDEPSQSSKAGFIYGANDQRLMNKNMNIFQLESSKDVSYFMLELDIAPLSSDKEALLNIYRVGFHPEDKKEIPLKSIKIPTSLINNKNKYQKHKIRFSNNLGHTHIYINEQEITYLGVNPLGQGGDFIAFPVVGDIGFYVPNKQKAQFSDIEIRNLRTPSNILLREDGQIIEGREKGFFLTHNPSRNSMPMLRTTFDAKNKIAKARIYVTSRGIYEFYINGQRVGNDYFNPGMTQYNKTQMYQTFDVTSLLRSGKNAMGAILAEGWWSGASTFMGEYWNFFGDRQSLLFKMIITYEDGTDQIIVSDPDSWQYYNDGAILYGSFFQGEVYDARKESQIEGWSTIRYNTSNWKKAQEIPLNGTISLDGKEYNDLKLIGQFGQTVKQIKELTAQSVEEVRPGVYVYDMGQNMVGVPSITLKGFESGKKINLRFAEVKYPDLPEYKNNVGMIMLENIRAAMAQDIYITKGSEHEIIQPRFTFHGYRFIEITGIPKALPLDAVKGIVISSIHELTSSYQTSNLKVNKLWENITWSTYANFLSIPTDCPQRNERLGWSGDISVFARAATYLADVPQFLRRHMLAMRDAQRENGRFSDIAPLDIGFGGILWGSAGITVPWEAYQQYNDMDMLTEHYDAMKKYIHFILNETIDKETGLIVQQRAWGDLTGWLGPEDGCNDKSLLWEAYFLYDLDIMCKTANLLGKTEDMAYFSKIYNERKEFFNKTYIQPSTGKTIFSAFEPEKENELVDTQTSYILPLVFNIVDEKDKAKMIANFKDAVIRENHADNKTVCPPYSLMTGFIGTSWINKALSDNGLSDVAYRLFQQTTYPSWLYSVEQGATTIWERLNSYTHTDGFGGNNRMNSFNHYSFGAVASWMYAYSLGIERDEDHPGFKHFILKPEPDPTGEMTFAKGHYDSMYGRIESEWNINGKITSYKFVVPANTTATLYLKVNLKDVIKSGDKLFRSINGVNYRGEKNGKCIFVLQAGKYNIQIGPK